MHNLKSLRKTEENMHEKSILEKMDQNETQNFIQNIFANNPINSTSLYEDSFHLEK